MPQRFSGIKYLIKEAKKMAITGLADPQPNIAAYKAYRRGTSTAYKTTAVLKTGSHPVTLIPFCAEGITSRYASKMSGRAFTAMSQNSITDALLNIDSGGASGTQQATVGATKTYGFVPAKAVLFVGTGSTSAATSGITLLSYKKRAGTSYTYPLGKGLTATEETYPQVTGKIFAAVSTGNRTVSFKPEVAA